MSLSTPIFTPVIDSLGFKMLFSSPKQWAFVGTNLMLVDVWCGGMGQGRTTKVSPPYLYECVDCGRRVNADRQPVECSKCEGSMRNISKPRE